MDVLAFISILLAAVYGLSLLLLTGIWIRVVGEKERSPVETNRFTIVIPARNEAHRLPSLLQDLREQEYESALMRIVVVDDNSEDNTASVVQKEMGGAIPIRLIRQSESLPGFSPKKSAIWRAAKEANSEWLITLDADCRVGPHWLPSINLSVTAETGLVAGPVLLKDARGFLQVFQDLELSALAGVTGIGFFAGKPAMANGANFAMRRKEFLEIGYGSYKQNPSGDDQFYLERFALQSTLAMKFNSRRQGVVWTYPESTISGFLGQRRRWAGKWKQGRPGPNTWLAILIFMLNANFLAAPVLASLDFLTWTGFAYMLGGKILTEYLFLHQVRAHFGLVPRVMAIVISSLIFPLYVVLMGALGQWSRYTWKGRKW